MVEKYQKIGIKLRLTPGQLDLIKSIKQHEVTFLTGESGTGKTLISLAEAYFRIESEALQEGLTYIRPAVQSQEDLGFLPGSVDDKLEPYMSPFWTLSSSIVPPKRLENYIKRGDIELRSIAFLRGLTFHRKVVILDEAQNTTRGQMELFLTRLGRGSKYIIIGDTDQKDIPGAMGLEDAIARFRNLPEVCHVHLGPENNMRSPLVNKIVEGYKQEAPRCKIEGAWEVF